MVITSLEGRGQTEKTAGKSLLENRILGGTVHRECTRFWLTCTGGSGWLHELARLRTPLQGVPEVLMGGLWHAGTCVNLKRQENPFEARVCAPEFASRQGTQCARLMQRGLGVSTFPGTRDGHA
ncbi:hypothetical protein CRG98_028714 [Punica granatum]|uniref:Uncharacterized protein n=1 Tax=Punica granatum TaxID=22663 RepID=A0A2I0J581_PUNGR|nr:hypothetical protein CRG98_028714 [Punica granatum]